MSTVTEPTTVPVGIDPADPVFLAHRGGKTATGSRVKLEDRDDLSIVYTPGVARVCTAIAEEPELRFEYTSAPRTVAVVTDGTAVLGLGDIGPAASLPVMEGKALLFAKFGGVDATPIALATTDVDEIVETVVRLAPSFGGINLEDISAPRCFEIERRLDEALDIPVFHDDQHGTAVVTLAGLRNAAAVTGRQLADLRVVVSGAGAAGTAIADVLVAAGVGDVAVTDRTGILHPDRPGIEGAKLALALRTNRQGRQGTPADALAGADVFIGVSGGQVGEEALSRMAPGCFIFAMANPTPEVHPDLAHRYASVVATGRSDFPNQLNNVLAFPGIFRGALDARATRITVGMRLAAAEALAGVVADELSVTKIVPDPFDPRTVPAVAAAVAAAARAEGVARA
ncbi:NADP-dependent malic enzyme [Kineococcus gynurae]|uniref:NADP-dependent malic enzyme n=1 Tax=Kineococcus gynurae TaxID=452979 RepID=A0ABV5LS78_9ACTN